MFASVCTVTLIHCHTVMPLPHGLCFVILSSSVDIVVPLNMLTAAPLYIVSDSHCCPTLLEMCCDDHTVNWREQSATGVTPPLGVMFSPVK